MSTKTLLLAIILGAYIGFLFGAWAFKSSQVTCGPFILSANMQPGVYICTASNSWHEIEN